MEEMVQAAKTGGLRTGGLTFADRVFQNDIYLAIQETRQVRRSNLLNHQDLCLLLWRNPWVPCSQVWQTLQCAARKSPIPNRRLHSSVSMQIA